MSLRDETVKSRLWRDKLGIGETGKRGRAVGEYGGKGAWERGRMGDRYSVIPEITS